MLALVAVSMQRLKVRHACMAAIAIDMITFNPHARRAHGAGGGNHFLPGGWSGQTLRRLCGVCTVLDKLPAKPPFNAQMPMPDLVIEG